MMRVVFAAVAVLLALTGCAATPTPAPTIAAPVTQPAPATTAPPAPAQVGDTVSNLGITITVKSARVADSIEVNETGSRPGSGFEKYTERAPDQGGKFVVVETHVVNNAQVSLDLTCGLPVLTKLLDDRDRNFDTIDDLYKIKGNPECNDQLQPGFESDMTWVYMLPTNAAVAGWAFRDTTNLSNAQDYTYVRLAV